MTDFIPNIDENSGMPKYLQVVNAFEDAVNSKTLKVGDSLPSVNELCTKCELSRDTVFKAYTELKERKLIESVPNKGYYVASNNHNVFLFLDTLKAYKEVLYGEFRNALPNYINVDVHFHHYNPKVFKDIIRTSIGKYSHYIIMNFDDVNVRKALVDIDPSKLLCIDWKIHVPNKSSFVGQDFNAPIINELLNAKEELNKYSKLNLIYPDYTNHPYSSVEAFCKFSNENGYNYEVINNILDLKPNQGELYISVSDRALAKLLDFCHEYGYTLGKDVGLISYNETPTKKYIKDGITVISTDFKAMGLKMAEFVKNGNKVNEIIPTKLIKRSSL